MTTDQLPSSPPLPSHGPAPSPGPLVRLWLPDGVGGVVTLVSEDDDAWMLSDCMGAWKLSKNADALVTPVLENAGVLESTPTGTFWKSQPITESPLTQIVNVRRAARKAERIGKAKGQHDWTIETITAKAGHGPKKCAKTTKRSAKAEKLLSGWTPTETVVKVEKFVKGLGWIEDHAAPKGKGGKSAQPSTPTYRMKPTDTMNADGKLVNKYGHVKTVQHDECTILQQVNGDWVTVRTPNK